MKKLFLILILCLACNFLFAAGNTLFWISGSATWNPGTKWALTSGGIGTVGATIGDSCIIDDFSDGAVITVATGATCRALNMGPSNNVTLTLTDDLIFDHGFKAGTSTVVTETSAAYDFKFVFTNAGSVYGQLDPNGNTIRTNIYIDGGGQLELMSALTQTSPNFLYINYGELLSNNAFNITTGSFYSNDGGIGNPTALTLGSQTVTILDDNTTSPNSYSWYVENGSAFTFTSGTSTVVFSNTSGSKELHLDNLGSSATPYVFYDLQLYGCSIAFTSIVNGASGQPIQVHQFKLIGPPSFTSISMDWYVDILEIDGTSGNLNYITSTGTLNMTGGNVCVNYVELANVPATGAAGFYAANSTDSGGNTGWTFADCPSPPSTTERSFGLIIK